MKILNKRYLFIINSLLILSAVLSLSLLPVWKLTVACICVVFAMIISVAYILGRSHRIFAIVSIFSCVAIFLGVASSYIFFDVHCKNQEKYDGKELILRATVLSEEYASDNTSGYIVKVHAISGENKSVSFKARFECNYVSELKAGDEIYAKVTATLIDDNVNGYNISRAMKSEGIRLTLTSNEDIDYKNVNNNKNSIEVFFAKLNYSASYNLNYLLSGEEGRLASALLLGNKGAISSETNRDFSRAGVSHILALSGMHMSILMGGIATLLKKLRVKRTPRGIFLIATSLFYLALTGFSVSATRSVIMLLCVYLSTLLCYKSDTLTSLSVAGAVIVLFSSGAVIDVGFWMSYAATFGIVVFMPIFDSGFEYITKKQKRALWLKRILKSSMGLLFAGIFALIGLSAVLCIFTREYSKYSLLSSVILSLPTAAVILLSAISPIFANVPHIGDTIISANRHVCRFMLDFCADISEKYDAVFVFNYDFIDFFVALICISIFVAVVFSFKKKWLSPIIPILAISLLVINVCVYEANHKNQVNIDYVNISSQSDVIVISSGNKSVICDLSQGRYNALSTAANYVRLQNASEIQALMLTELNSYHVSSTSKLFKSQRVRELWVPTPVNEDEYYILKSLLKVAEKNGVAVKIYENQSELRAFGDVTLLVDAQFIERSSVPTILLEIRSIDDNVVYTSAAYSERVDMENIADKIGNADRLIIGARGPRVKEKYSLFGNSNIDEIIICDIDRAIYLDTEGIGLDVPIYVGKKHKNIVFNRD